VRMVGGGRNAPRDGGGWGEHVLRVSEQCNHVISQSTRHVIDLSSAALPAVPQVSWPYHISI